MSECSNSSASETKDLLISSKSASKAATGMVRTGKNIYNILDTICHFVLSRSPENKLIPALLDFVDSFQNIITPASILFSHILTPWKDLATRLNVLVTGMMFINR